ncbi:PIF-like protein, partial [Trifolium medium]|nr:PIF-like protein [Trifolium medium]
QKRKRASGAEKKGKKKFTPSVTIAQAVKEIAETCKSRNDAISKASIGEVMAEIQTMDEVMNDLELHTMCCQLMMFKSAREKFVSLRGD